MGPLAGQAVSLRAEVIHGDCLDVMRTLAPGSVDAIVTDPPYSSGGQFRGDRTQTTRAKYVNSDSVAGQIVRDFAGDNRDQRSFLAWCSLWLALCHTAAKPGATLCCFSDWRQVPTLSDAIQCGGWVWRGLSTWWKPGIRMQRGRFSASSEFVLYGSRGIPTAGERSPQNVFSFAPVNGDDKEHIAEKPVEVVRWLLGVTRPGDLVLDPFCGSGAVGVACVLEGRAFLGYDIDPLNVAIARRRIAEAQAQGNLFGVAA